MSHTAQQHFPYLSRRWLISAACLLLLMATSLTPLGSHLSHSLSYSRPAADTVGLARYTPVIDALAIAGISHNLSGLTFDDQRQQLWSVVNNPPELLSLSTEGQLTARYPLTGLHDVEGVTYLGDDLLLLIEERSQRLVVIAVPERGQPIEPQALASLQLQLFEHSNQGFEGVGYDRANDRLFVVKEHSPRKLYEIQGLKRSLNSSAQIQVIDREAWIADKPMARDFSSVHYDEQSGHLLLLSDESKMILELDHDGTLASFRSLWSWFSGLKHSVPQAEGLTLDNQGHLYLVSEPNLFYALHIKQ